MNTSLLRKIRIVTSILLFIPTTLVLMDFTGQIPNYFTNWIIYFQFVPSLLKSIAIFTLSATGFILVLILTALFGRVYCSSICPLGFLQDVVSFISRKISKKKKETYYLKEQKVLRWTLLLIPIMIFVLGNALGLSLIDPYSIYGRFAGNYIRPVAIWVNNLISSLLEYFRIYALSPYQIQTFNPVPFLITTAILGLVIYLSYKKGRLYCNTVCPVGTLLGLLSKISLFKIVIEKEKKECLSCGICARDCKANCINSDEKTVDMSRCVACFNCLDSCPTDAIKYKPALFNQQYNNITIDQSKRNFLISTGLYLSSFSTILAQAKKQIVITKPSTIPIFRKNAVSPPGSVGIERFNSKCTACNLCVSSCPTQVLQPSFLEYGFLGMLQPRMDNLAGFCNFDCVICGEICPTGAILSKNVDEKRLTQIGKSKFVKDNCVVFTQKTECGACSEHCPTKAVHMIPEGKLFAPEVREEYCVGCGACEFACPTKPYKAIYVEGNRLHEIAKKNIEEKKLEKIDFKEEFPF